MTPSSVTNSVTTTRPIVVGLLSWGLGDARRDWTQETHQSAHAYQDQNQLACARWISISSSDAGRRSAVGSSMHCALRSGPDEFNRARSFLPVARLPSNSAFRAASWWTATRSSSPRGTSPPARGRGRASLSYPRRGGRRNRGGWNRRDA